MFGLRAVGISGMSFQTLWGFSGILDLKIGSELCSLHKISGLMVLPTFAVLGVFWLSKAFLAPFCEKPGIPLPILHTLSSRYPAVNFQFRAASVLSPS